MLQMILKVYGMPRVIGKVNAGLLLISSAFALSACGGGSGSSKDSKAPAAVEFRPGIFKSAIFSGPGNEGTGAFTLLSSSGKYAITSTESTSTANQARVSGTLRFPSKDTLSDPDASYVFSNEKWMSIAGSLTGMSINLEEFATKFISDPAEPSVVLDVVSIRDDELSDLGVTLQELHETYSLPGSVFAVTIDPDGSVTGSAKECGIIGSITIPNPAYNIFEGSLTFSGCPDIDEASSEQRNGTYDVIGYLKPLGQGVKRLVFSSDNGEVLSVFSGTNGTD